MSPRSKKPTTVIPEETARLIRANSETIARRAEIAQMLRDVEFVIVNEVGATLTEAAEAFEGAAARMRLEHERLKLLDRKATVMRARIAEKNASKKP